MVTIFVAQIVHTFGLFLAKCYFSSESIFGLHFIDIGQFLLKPSGHPALSLARHKGGGEGEEEEASKSK